VKSKVYIGPAGWSYKDWEGVVYPAKKDKGFDQLRFLSHLFNVIEINSSFYRPPAIGSVKSWVNKVKDNPEFCFTCKLWQEYTHQQNQFPGAAEENLVKPGLDELLKNNRLGALLIQFPWSFKNTSENQHWLEQILTIFKDYYPVVEVRHQSWLEKSFIAFLDEQNATFANIDQPVIGRSIPLTSLSSRKLSYLRLHGRNARNWFAPDASVASRYDYLYRENELVEIKTKIEDLMENSPKTFIIFNNHFRGQAIANAMQMLFILNEKRVPAPEELIHTYPQLKNISQPILNTPAQASLF
jgi:uncharacterized protein YecE (DUF72 family)